MMRRLSVLVWGAFVLGGCGWEAQLPTVPETHPANPEAEAAPAVELSNVLRVDEPVMMPQPVPMTHRGMGEHPHEGHQMEMAP